MGNSELAKEHSSRGGNSSQSIPLLGSAFSGYDGRSNGGGGSGSVAMDTSAFNLFVSRHVAEYPPVNLTAMSFVQSTPERYSFGSSASTLETFWHRNRYEHVTDLTTAF